MWGLLDFKHLEDSNSHDYAELRGCGEHMEHIDDSNRSYLPSSGFKVFTDCLRVVVNGMSVYNCIATKADICVDQYTGNIDYLHHLLKFIVRRCLAENLNHEIMNRVAHDQGSCQVTILRASSWHLTRSVLSCNLSPSQKCQICDYTEDPNSQQLFPEIKIPHNHGQY